MNRIFITTSIDGYIADRDGGLDWLHAVPNPDNDDMRYAAFMADVDPLAMGRITFETVCGFDGEWPYSKPVFVLSNSLTAVPLDYEDKVELVSGALPDILTAIHSQGYHSLYIDGGGTIHSFLQQDLID